MTQTKKTQTARIEAVLRKFEVEIAAYDRAALYWTAKSTERAYIEGKLWALRAALEAVKMAVV